MRIQEEHIQLTEEGIIAKANNGAKTMSDTHCHESNITAFGCKHAHAHMVLATFLGLG